MRSWILPSETLRLAGSNTSGRPAIALNVMPLTLTEPSAS